MPWEKLRVLSRSSEPLATVQGCAAKGRLGHIFSSAQVRRLPWHEVYRFAEVVVELAQIPFRSGVTRKMLTGVLSGILSLVGVDGISSWNTHTQRPRPCESLPVPCTPFRFLLMPMHPTRPSPALGMINRKTLSFSPTLALCRFGPRLANTARCTISQVPASANTGTADGCKGGSNGGKQEASVALRVEVESAKVLAASDQEDIRAQVVVSGGDVVKLRR